MLLNTVKCTGEHPTTKNCPAQNISGAQVEKLVYIEKLSFLYERSKGA